MLGQRALEAPTILVTNQHSLSDAEDFTEGYRALKLGSKFAPPVGHEVVPTERAQVLVSYLLSLNNSYAYPEEGASNTVKVAKEEEHKAPAAPGEKAPATPAKPQEGAPK